MYYLPVEKYVPKKFSPEKQMYCNKKKPLCKQSLFSFGSREFFRTC
jgi:hypothetical protein